MTYLIIYAIIALLHGLWAMGSKNAKEVSSKINTMVENDNSICDKQCWIPNYYTMGSH